MGCSTKLRPFLNSEKLEGESLDELITALSELKPKAKAIGTPSNGGAVNEQAVRQAQLQEAASVAKRSGRVEDIAAYTKLKQTLKKFGGIR